MLAQAGIGRIVLVDKDTLSWANTGRHPLGASRVGEGKAKGLAEKLRADFPHLTIEYLECEARGVAR
jgi:tRNA A37 threonylcarbamoyladenosine dehydratase